MQTYEWKLGKVAVCVLAAAVAGCSFSYSSESISNSISGSSESISRSSASSSGDGGGEAEALRDDIRVYTAAHVRAGGAAASLRSGLSELAERYGVTDWAADPAAFVAVGEGLAAAGAERSDLRAYERELADGDPSRAAAIERGWRNGTS